MIIFHYLNVIFCLNFLFFYDFNCLIWDSKFFFYQYSLLLNYHSIETRYLNSANFNPNFLKKQFFLLTNKLFKNTTLANVLSKIIALFSPIYF